VWTFLLAFVLIPFRMNALFVVTHEAWHFNVFRSRKANEWLGAGLAAYPIVMPFFKDRDTHWNHHRHVGTSRDPDAWAWNFDDHERGRLLRECLLVGSGLSYAVRILRVLAGRPAVATATTGTRPQSAITKGEILRLALVHLTILAIFWKTVGAIWYVPLWLFPGLATFPMVGMIREFLEHRRGALITYRRATLFERFTLGCFNFHLHAYHHAFASAPWFTLPEPYVAERAKKRHKIVDLPSYYGEWFAYLRGKSPKFSGPADDAPEREAGDQPLEERMTDE
jgi:fatty acid desaturase